MARTLLDVLREKLADMMGRLRRLVLGFARRTPEPEMPASAAARTTGPPPPAATPVPSASEEAGVPEAGADARATNTDGAKQARDTASGAAAVDVAPEATGEREAQRESATPMEQAGTEPQPSGETREEPEARGLPKGVAVAPDGTSPTPPVPSAGEPHAEPDHGHEATPAPEASPTPVGLGSDRPSKASEAVQKAMEVEVPAERGGEPAGGAIARHPCGGGWPVGKRGAIAPPERALEVGADAETVVSPSVEEASGEEPVAPRIVAPAAASSEAPCASPEGMGQLLPGPKDAVPPEQPSGDGVQEGPGSIGLSSEVSLPIQPPEDAGGTAEAPAVPFKADLPDYEAALERPPENNEGFIESGSDAQRSQPRERRRVRPDVEEMARPAVAAAPAIEDDEYRLWNRAVAQQCLFGDDGAEALYLTVTPTILAAAYAEVRPQHMLPEDAAAAFVRAVSAVYHGRVLGSRGGLRVLRRCGLDGLPDCIAFLAASVLAAYEMRSDEETAGTAYYKRLADLLNCELTGGHPRGFDPDEFEALWRFLEAWLRAEKGRQLALPGAEVGLRRYVAFPLLHVPLRRVDMERLPEFFWSAGYEPRVRIHRSTLDQDLAAWCLGAARFTAPGMAALADERRAAVLAQIAHELESWDGEQRDSRGRRSARVEILLEPVKGRPQLSYLARRPAAFPAVFDVGVRRLDAGEEGWYEPLPLRKEDGASLVEGFAWELEAGGLRFSLLRPPARAIALPESPEYAWFVSHKALRLGVRASVLCIEDLARAAADYLSTVSSQRCTPVALSGLPAGWCLFLNVRPQTSGGRPPDELAALEVEAVVDLIPRGGLRLGARWAWLAGAPPRLAVAGLEPGERVTLDGMALSVGEDGLLVTDDHLARPGTHIIEAAGMRRRIEIVEPRVPPSPSRRNPSMAALALPRGEWTILGAVPGEIAVPAARSHAGAVVWCGFRPVWAVEVGAGRGARVLSLCAEPPPPSRPVRFALRSLGGRALQWSSRIYEASIRRPVPRAVDGRPCEADVRGRWAEYGQAAREIKRAFRRGRR